MSRPVWLQLFIDVPASGWDAAVPFWAAALGCTVSPARGETGQFVTLVPPSGDAWVKLQRVDAEGGVHLDLDGLTRPEAVRAVLAAGASPAWRYHDVEVLRSPGGLLFCCTLGRPGRLYRGGDTVADQVAIDIPALWWDAEVAFWTQVLGREPVQGRRPEFVFLPDPDAGARVLLQKLGEASGPVRAHPDLAVRDRAAVTQRHVGLGAEVVDVRERWTVLRAPGGQVYCLTDRDPATGL